MRDRRLRATSFEIIAFPFSIIIATACGTATGDQSVPHEPKPDASAGGGSDAPIHASATLVKSNCSPVAATSDGRLMAFGDGWIYTSIGREAQGADLWRMKPDGTNQQRVTFFGGAWSSAQLVFAQAPGFPEPAYSIVGGMATVPDGFIAGVIHDDNAMNIDAWRIDIAR